MIKILNFISSPKNITKYVVIIPVVWTGALLAFYFVDSFIDRKDMIEEARISAVASFEKDIVYRRWNAAHDGVYVPLTEKTPSNPFLDVPDKNVTTQNRISLTLINPAYMTRQVHELAMETYGIRGHITSLNPIRPQNSPDTWEVVALNSFQAGVREVSSEETMEGERYLRFMRPMVTEKPCLKCHGKQGYREGDIRGGISISIPLEPYYAIHAKHVQFSAWMVVLIWMTGVVSFSYGINRISKQMKINEAAEKKRKQAEEKLIQQHYYLEKAQELGQIGTWELDIIHNKLYWTDENCRIFGVPEGSVVDYEIFIDKVHPDDREYVNRQWKAGIEGAPYDIEHRLLIDGNIKWVREKADVKFDSEGQAVNAIGFTQDITDRKRWEDALRAEHARFVAVMDSLDALVYVSDLETYELIFLNAHGRQAWGDHVGEKCWAALQEGQSGPCEFCTNDKLLDSYGKPAPPYIWEHRNTANGKWYQCHDQAIRWPDGRLVRLEIATNITEFKKVKEEEQRLSQDYYTLFREMLDGFALHEIICDTEGKPIDYRFLAANPAFEKMTGLKAKDITGKTILEILPETEQHWIDTYGRVALTGEPASFENFAKELGKHFVVTAFQPSPNQFACIFADITERKQLKERLQQAQKMESMGNLAGGIAHDFNNILVPIIGMSEMLVEDLPSDSLEYENAQEIYVAGKRAGELVKQILAFSRKSEHKMTPVIVQNILKDVLTLCRSSIPTDVEIHENIQADCGSIKADATQIHQVAMNLITNAYHAVQEKGGRLSVTLKQITLGKGELTDSTLEEGQYIVLSVSDTGVGIKPNIVGKIFEPYFTTKEKGKGTGLGLAVVFGIIKKHQGDIKVYSEMDKGTTFNVYLPLMKSSEETVSVDQVPIMETGTERILLVDDEKSITKLGAQMLSRLGYRVTEQTRSLDALKVFKKNPESFDLVVTDMTMPDMTGDQLAGKLLSIRPDIPIVICTGFSERINQEQAESIGVKGFLMKPIDKFDMAKMVRKVLDNEEFL